MTTHSERRSIAPTYDRRETGDRYTVESRINGRRISLTPIADPFVTQRLHVGWMDLLRGLLRGHLIIETITSGDQEAIEDVLELNADYLGTQRSTRRAEWNAGLERGLGDMVEVQEGASPDLRVMFRRGEDGYCWASVLGCAGVRQEDDGKVVKYVPLSVAEALADALEAAKDGHWWCHPSSQREGDCQCGATKHNAAVDAALAAYRESYPAPVPAREEGTT